MTSKAVRPSFGSSVPPSSQFGMLPYSSLRKISSGSKYFLSSAAAMRNAHVTVETLYNTVNFCWSTHKRHSIARPKGRGMGCLFVSSKGNILCRLIKIELYKIFAIINRAIKGLHCTWITFLLFKKSKRAEKYNTAGQNEVFNWLCCCRPEVTIPFRSASGGDHDRGSVPYFRQKITIDFIVSKVVHSRGSV